MATDSPIVVPAFRFADVSDGDLRLRLDDVKATLERVAAVANEAVFGKTYRAAPGEYVSVGNVVNIQGQTARLASEAARYLAGYGVVTRADGAAIWVRHYGIVDVLTDSDDWNPTEDFSLAIGEAGVAGMVASAPTPVATPSATRYRTIIGYPIARVRKNLYRALFNPVGTRVLVPVE